MISASGVEGRKEGVEVPSCRVRRHRDEARMLSWIETGRMLTSHQRGLMFLAARRYEYAALGMIIGLSSSGKICQIEHYRGRRSTIT